MLPAIRASPQISDIFAMLKTQFDEVGAPPTGPNSYAQFDKSFEGRLLPADENQHDFEQLEKLMRFITSTAECKLDFFPAKLSASARLVRRGCTAHRGRTSPAGDPRHPLPPS